MLEGEVPTQERVFQVSILLKPEIIFVNFETQVSILLKIIFVNFETQVSILLKSEIIFVNFETQVSNLLKSEIIFVDFETKVSILLKSEIIFVNFEKKVSILLKIIFVKHWNTGVSGSQTLELELQMNIGLLPSFDDNKKLYLKLSQDASQRSKDISWGPSLMSGLSLSTARWVQEDNLQHGQLGC